MPYQFEHGQWVHVESDYIHKEVGRPVLDALARPGFEDAFQEFEQALEHARSGNTKEAATEATKALMSTIKCICAARGWTYPPNATAKPLFDVLVARGFAESWMDGHLPRLREHPEQDGRRPRSGAGADADALTKSAARREPRSKRHRRPLGGS